MKSSEWKAAFAETGILTGETKNDGDEHVAYCPNCEEPGESKTPSASFNFKKKKFHCFSCKKNFSLKELLMFARDDARERRTEKKKGDKKTLKEEPLPSEEQVMRWVGALHATNGCLQAFKDKRGLSNEIIAKYKIGYRKDKRRYTLPIYDRSGQLVNVRYYGPRSKAKMINHTGHGEARLLGWEALEEDEILLVEGEMDWLTALDQGFNSMTWTSGVSSWQDRFSALFEGKTVFLCFDDDEAGRMGARRVALSLDRAGAKCHIVQLNIAGIKGGDLTDYFHALGNSAGDFRELMNDSRFTVAGRVKQSKGPQGELEEVGVEDSMSPENHSKNLSIVATVHGKAAAPYVLPREIEYNCGQDWGDKCKKCGLAIFDGNRKISVEATDPAVLSMVDKSDEQVNRSVLKMAEIPPTCPKVEPYYHKVWTVEELQVMPSVEERSSEVLNPVDRTVYNVGSHNLQINKTFQITGTSMPHPRDQKSVFQSWECEPVEVDIDRFEMTPEIYEDLTFFQPDNWQQQTPWEKLKDIAYDMSINITQIYGRPELHIGYDLSWHSVSAFYFGGKLQTRGWVECLIVGDTRTGKSEVAHRLSDHYRSGVVMDCENASLAGLVGGAAQKGVSKQWGITWGTIPLNDKRLVVLDEAGGLKPEIISAMSSVRSLGVAEIAKMGGQY